MNKLNGFLTALLLTFGALLPLKAQPTTLDGVISPGEYGDHTNGRNAWTDAQGRTWYLRVDDVFLCLAVNANGNAANDEFVFYLNSDRPDVSGTDQGVNFDGVQFGTLPFRANFGLYVRNDFHQHHLSNVTGQTAFPVTANNSASIRRTSTGNVQEIAVEWALIGGRPASFDFFLYLNGGNPYGGNAIDINGPTGQNGRYFFSVGAVSPQSNFPFERLCYTQRSAATATIGAGTYYDVTLANGIAEASGNITIQNNLSILAAATLRSTGVSTITMSGANATLSNDGTLDPNNGFGNDLRLVITGTTTLAGGQTDPTRYRFFDLSIPTGGSLLSSPGVSRTIEWQFGTININGTLNLVNGANSTRVTIRGTGGNTVTVSGTGAITLSDLLIGGAAQLQAATTGSTRINLRGDFENNGILSPANGTGRLTFGFVGNTRQQIRGLGIAFQDVVLNNLYGLQTNDNIRINGNLTIQEGLFFLGDKELLFGETSNVTAAGSSPNFDGGKTIIPGDRGKLTKIYPQAGGIFSFPLGDTTGMTQNTLATITVANVANNGLPVTFSIGMTNRKPFAPWFSPIRKRRLDDYLNRYWTISNSGNFDFTIESGFFATDVVGARHAISFATLTDTTWGAPISGFSNDVTVNSFTLSFQRRADFVLGAITNAVLGIEEPGMADFGLRAFPNPTQGELQVSFEAPAADHRLSVSDLLGRTLWEETYPTTGEWQRRQTVRLPDLQEGIYLLHLHIGQKRQSMRLMVRP